MDKIFFSERKQVYEKVVKQKQINSSTFKTQTSLWRKKKQVFERKKNLWRQRNEFAWKQFYESPK